MSAASGRLPWLSGLCFQALRGGPIHSLHHTQCSWSPPRTLISNGARQSLFKSKPPCETSFLKKFCHLFLLYNELLERAPDNLERKTLKRGCGYVTLWSERSFPESRGHILLSPNLWLGGGVGGTHACGSLRLICPDAGSVLSPTGKSTSQPLYS